jgi:hypothetical protein
VHPLSHRTAHFIQPFRTLPIAFQPFRTVSCVTTPEREKANGYSENPQVNREWTKPYNASDAARIGRTGTRFVDNRAEAQFSASTSRLGGSRSTTSVGVIAAPQARTTLSSIKVSWNDTRSCPVQGRRLLL